jgi:proteic killer suppression protein
MRIRNVIHKGLRRFVETDDTSGLPAAAVPKLRKIISFLQDMTHEDELRSVPSWKAHEMAGGRRGTWSLSVTRNWRITFQIDRSGIDIIDLNYEDYH